MKESRIYHFRAFLLTLTKNVQRVYSSLKTKFWARNLLTIEKGFVSLFNSFPRRTNILEHTTSTIPARILHNSQLKRERERNVVSQRTMKILNGVRIKPLQVYICLGPAKRQRRDKSFTYMEWRARYTAIFLLCVPKTLRGSWMALACRWVIFEVTLLLVIMRQEQFFFVVGILESVIESFLLFTKYLFFLFIRICWAVYNFHTCVGKIWYSTDI